MCKDEAEFQLWTATLSALIEGKIDRSAYVHVAQANVSQTRKSYRTKQTDKFRSSHIQGQSREYHSSCSFFHQLSLSLSLSLSLFVVSHRL